MKNKFLLLILLSVCFTIQLIVPISFIIEKNNILEHGTQCQYTINHIDDEKDNLLSIVYQKTDENGKISYEETEYKLKNNNAKEMTVSFRSGIVQKKTFYLIGKTYKDKTVFTDICDENGSIFDNR